MRNINFNVKNFVAFVLTAGMIFQSCSDMEKRYEGEPLVTYPPVEITEFSPLSGPAGIPITISGNNFGDFKDPAKIYFNGIEAANIVSYSDTQVVVISPVSRTGPISVKVWTHSDVSLSQFTYEEGATLTSIAPELAPAGGQVNIIGTNFGTSSDNMQVIFGGGVEAKIISVIDTEIVVEAPLYAKNGAITLIMPNRQTLISSQVFTFDLSNGVKYEFESDQEGWTSSLANLSISNGKLLGNVTENGLLSIENANFPIAPSYFNYLAVNLSAKPLNSDLISLSLTYYGTTYTDFARIWAVGNVYVFDLNSIQAIREIEGEEEVSIAINFDNASNGEKVAIDWIRTYDNLDDIVDQNKLAYGHLVYAFDDNESGSWVPQQSAAYELESGYLKVIYAQAAPKYRADFARDRNQNTERWSLNYPIIAFRAKNIPTKDLSNITLDARLTGVGASDTYNEDYRSSDVIYWDFSALTESQLAAINANDGLFTIKIADITALDAEVTGYDVDWVRTFASVEELKEFIGVE